ncbi:hypothetical protein CIB84_014663 [Bambusicola thoracicus]|uniref:Phosducin domain-containing protein n=1 Tax=Bambusicola thoracicus TaxID=9083 RepID=A0A2P4SBY4_BAMTH|nr:hypothetical protein CIB84_014663 [Bambusicola thoracicus]
MKEKQSEPKRTSILQRSKFSNVNDVTHHLPCRYNRALLPFPSIPVCLLVNEHLSHLASKFPEAKFVKAAVNSCIQSYHDRCLPTILVYRSGEIKARFIGVAECGGMRLKAEELEWKLAEVGAIESDLEENPKKDIVNMMTLSMQNLSVHEKVDTKSSDVLKPRIT